MRNCLLRVSPFILLFVLVLACRNVEVSPTEKELFVRGQDLRNFGVEVPNPERYEKFTKTRFFDGTEDIEYEFEPPESDAVMYMAQTISFAPKKSDAQLGQAAEDSVIGLGLTAYGLEKVEVPDFYRYGDSSTFYALRKDGQNVGNYFLVIEGGKTFSFLISGFYVDDPETWREIVEPKLKLFSAHKPK